MLIIQTHISISVALERLSRRNDTRLRRLKVVYTAPIKGLGLFECDLASGQQQSSFDTTRNVAAVF